MLEYPSHAASDIPMSWHSSGLFALSISLLFAVTAGTWIDRWRSWIYVPTCRYGKRVGDNHMPEQEE